MELRYNYFLVRDGAAPRIDPRNPKYRLTIACWKRTLLLVTRALEPRLISGIA